jgi:hypothetical protein
MPDNSPKALRRDIEGISKRISSIEKAVSGLEQEFRRYLRNAPWKDDNNSGDPQQNPSHNSDPAPRNSALADSGSSKGGSDTHQGSEDRKPWWIRVWAWKPWKRLLSVAVGAAGICYAVITWNQWRDANRSSRIEQRAWVIPYRICAEPPGGFNTTDVCPTPAGPESRVVILVMIKNYGKTPALSVSALRVESIVSSDVPIDVSQIASYFNAPEKDTRYMAHMMAPEQTMNVNNGDHPVSPEDAAAIFGAVRSKILVAHGTVWYSDIFGVKHWTQYCFLSTQSMASWMPCPATFNHNQIDGNQE